MSEDSSKQSAETLESNKFLAIVEAAVTGILILTLPAYAAGYLLIALGGRALSDQTVLQFLYVLLTELLVIGLLMILMRRFKLSWKAIGLSRASMSVVGWTLTGFAIYLFAYALIYTAANSLLPLDTDQRQELGFDTGVAGWQLILIGISLVILPPIVEEIVFRGYIYTRLRRALPIWIAAVIVSIIFAIGHLQIGSGNALLWVAALDTFVLSMVLVWLREKTGSLWASIGVHMLKNGLAFTSLFLLNL